MPRKKALIGLGVLVLAAIAIIPVKPKHGDRPHMTHSRWSSNAAEITELLSEYGEGQRALGNEMVEVNVDQLTGMDGYSLLGIESFFGRRTTTVAGYISKEDASHFVSDGKVVWLDEKAIGRLRKIAMNSEQVGRPKR